jgi:cytochrome c oxidase cbb3-type subunit 3
MQTILRARVLIAFSWFALMLMMASGCNSSRSVSVAASSSPNRTNVGPVPGGQPTELGQVDPYIGNAEAIQDGRRLFNWYNCSGCHGGHGGGGMGPSLRDEIWIYGSRDDQIFDSIAEGRSKGMPAWGSKIPENQIWQLVAYIKSMRTPQEADPPQEPADEEVRAPSPSMPAGVPVYK